MDGDNALNDRIKNENIGTKLELSSVKDKIRKTRIRWFGHVQRRPINATMRKSDSLEVRGTSKERRNLRKFG